MSTRPNFGQYQLCGRNHIAIRAFSFSFGGMGRPGIPFPIGKPRGYPWVGANAGLHLTLVGGWLAVSRPDVARRPVPDKWATIGHWLDRPHSPSDHPGLAFALVGWAIVALTSCLERRRQERHTERETNSPFSCRSASACEKPPNDEVRVMFTVGWLVVLFGVLAMRWADGSFHSQ